MSNEERTMEIVEVEEEVMEKESIGTKAKGFWQKHKKKVIGIGAVAGAVVGIGALLVKSCRNSDDDDIELIDLDEEENIFEDETTTE